MKIKLQLDNVLSSIRLTHDEILSERQQNQANLLKVKDTEVKITKFEKLIVIFAILFGVLAEMIFIMNNNNDVILFISFFNVLFTVTAIASVKYLNTEPLTISLSLGGVSLLILASFLNNFETLTIEMSLTSILTTFIFYMFIVLTVEFHREIYRINKSHYEDRLHIFSDISKEKVSLYPEIKEKLDEIQLLKQKETIQTLKRLDELSKKMKD